MSGLPEITRITELWLPFFVALMRVSGLFLIDPFLSSPIFPMRVRALAASGLAVALVPVVQPAMPAVEPHAAAMAGLLLSELGVGLIIGLGIRVIVEGARMAGGIAGMQIGLRADAMVDPMGGGAQSDVASNVMGLVALTLLVTANVHHLAIKALAVTWGRIPPGSFTVDGQVALAAGELSGLVISTGISISMPVLAAVFLTQVGLAMLGRTVPQLNVFVVGFLVTITVGLGMLMLNLRNLPMAVEETTMQSLRIVSELLMR